MSGREAYYLLAVARRIRATEKEHYEDAADALRDARDCLAIDKIMNAGIGITEDRFNCEALALALSRYYFQRNDTNGNDRCDLSVGEVHKKARELLDGLKSEPMIWNESRPDWSQKTDLRTGTQASIATNLLQVFVIDHFRKRMGWASLGSSPVSIGTSTSLCQLSESTRISMRNSR